MRNISALIIVALLFWGCGGSDSKGGLTQGEEYTSEVLNLLNIQGEYTIESDDGLTFSITTSKAKDVSVYLYSREGNLSSEYTEIIGTCLGSSSSFSRNCTFENSTVGATVSFSLVNRNEHALNFSVVAFHTGDSAEGNATEPEVIGMDSLHSGRVDYLQDSYYTFEKETGGVTEIRVMQTDSLTGTTQHLVWTLQDENGNYVTATGGDLTQLTTSSYNQYAGGTCEDDYTDKNVSCSAYLSSGEYSIRVINVSGAAYTEYRLLVSE